ncbi:hypothetical protein LZ554_003748 [Drepanopeziza brunnea f. sp. 'monogermtubi']|nr:hypothetical protein LZ554_003748 [Drepanopeziza brunnea f. sp. 'monogermtubi']
MPKEFLSANLLPVAQQDNLRNLYEREVSSRARAQITRSTAEFVQAKIEGLESDVEFWLMERTYMEDAYRRKALSKRQLDEALEDSPGQANKSR